MKTGQIQLKDYIYDLPDERIAKHPLPERTDSKLLVYKNGIEHSKFADLADHIPNGSHLVFNNTQVLPARIRMTKDSGARIEIFITEPISPHSDFQLAINARSPVVWKCIVGNSKRWKEGQVLNG